MTDTARLLVSWLRAGDPSAYKLALHSRTSLRCSACAVVRRGACGDCCGQVTVEEGPHLGGCCRYSKTAPRGQGHGPQAQPAVRSMNCFPALFLSPSCTPSFPPPLILSDPRCQGDGPEAQPAVHPRCVPGIHQRAGEKALGRFKGKLPPLPLPGGVPPPMCIEPIASPMGHSACE